MTPVSESEADQPTLRQANIVRQAEWDKEDGITAAYRGNELAGEVGEACNVIKKLERERLGIRGSRDTIDHLAEELADIVICTDLIAMQYGIDLDLAVMDKFNATSEKVGLKTRLRRQSASTARAKALEESAGEIARLREALQDIIDNEDIPTKRTSAGHLASIAEHALADPSTGSGGST